MRPCERGATLLLNLTNDAWYGRAPSRTSTRRSRLWRAVETRRDFIRSTNTGLTTAISATGEVLAEMPIFVAAAQRGRRALLEISTFYGAWGDVFAWTRSRSLGARGMVDDAGRWAAIVTENCRESRRCLENAGVVVEDRRECTKPSTD